jgi:hypothetical protein
VSPPVSAHETVSITNAEMERLFGTMLDSDDELLIFADEI